MSIANRLLAFSERPQQIDGEIPDRVAENISATARKRKYDEVDLQNHLDLGETFTIEVECLHVVHGYSANFTGRATPTAFLRTLSHSHQSY